MEIAVNEFERVEMSKIVLNAAFFAYLVRNFADTIFSPPPADEVENGDVDEYERELEAFKRFCSQSVPAESKAKVNLNIEDIVLKKKGPSVIGCS